MSAPHIDIGVALKKAREDANGQEAEDSNRWQIDSDEEQGLDEFEDEPEAEEEDDNNEDDENVKAGRKRLPNVKKSLKSLVPNKRKSKQAQSEEFNDIEAEDHFYNDDDDEEKKEEENEDEEIKVGRKRLPNVKKSLKALVPNKRKQVNNSTEYSDIVDVEDNYHYNDAEEEEEEIPNTKKGRKRLPSVKKSLKALVPNKRKNQHTDYATASQMEEMGYHDNDSYDSEDEDNSVVDQETLQQRCHRPSLVKPKAFWSWRDILAIVGALALLVGGTIPFVRLMKRIAEDDVQRHEPQPAPSPTNPQPTQAQPTGGQPTDQQSPTDGSLHDMFGH